MKIAVMQPYIYPYLGYFQLIYAVDKFIIYDDVNYIKGGWINRNNLLINNKANLFTLPLQHASPNKKINEIHLVNDNRWKTKLSLTIERNYKKAPSFHKVFPEIKAGLTTEENNIALFNYNQLKVVCKYLEIDTEIIPSSVIYSNQHLKGQFRIIDICMQEKATTYINAIGGMNLYDKDEFSKNDIRLQFPKMMDIKYDQGLNDFIPSLSIIDTMMYCSVDEIKQMLQQFSLQ